jgi:hypothetical protein
MDIHYEIPEDLHLHRVSLSDPADITVFNDFAQSLDDFYELFRNVTQTHGEAISQQTPKVFKVTLYADSWDDVDGTWYYTIPLNTNINNKFEINEYTIVELVPGASITADQLGELQAANIVDGGEQSSKFIYLKAFGAKPTMDIPVTFIARGELE